MGIVRYDVECAGCKAGIALRLAVGFDARQPFFFVCPKCSAATRGALAWKGGGATDLELTAGHQLTAGSPCEFTISINPDFPSVPNATGLDQPDGSAFLMFCRLLGTDRALLFQSATRQMRAIIGGDWVAIQRLTTYYLNRDWPHFDTGINKIKGFETITFTKEWQRDDILHRIYDLLLGPLLALDDSKLYLEMKAAWNPLWTQSRPNHDRLIAFAKTEVLTQGYRDVQRDLFRHLERYLVLVGGLLPGALCNMLPSQHQGKVDSDLRLFRDEYEVLRDLYIQTFETCHKGLRWVLGAANADANGNPDNFVAPAGTLAFFLKPPKNLDAFNKLVNADKRKWLECVPGWHTRWDEVFDRNLRNDIGHASAHHELITGLILRDSKSPIAYTRFVAKVQRVIHGLLALLNALKILRVYSHVQVS